MAKDRVERDDEDLVRLYLTDIGQYTLLTKDDEVRLAKAIEAGKEAIEALDAGGKELTAAKKRELRRTARQGATSTGCARTGGAAPVELSSAIQRQSAMSCLWHSMSTLGRTWAGTLDRMSCWLRPPVLLKYSFCQAAGSQRAGKASGAWVRVRRAPSS